MDFCTFLTWGSLMNADEALQTLSHQISHVTLAAQIWGSTGNLAIQFQTTPYKLHFWCQFIMFKNTQRPCTSRKNSIITGTSSGFKAWSRHEIHQIIPHYSIQSLCVWLALSIRKLLKFKCTGSSILTCARTERLEHLHYIQCRFWDCYFTTARKGRLVPFPAVQL